jgi:hypothetical protein
VIFGWPEWKQYQLMRMPATKPPSCSSANVSTIQNPNQIDWVADLTPQGGRVTGVVAAAGTPLLYAASLVCCTRASKSSRMKGGWSGVILTWATPRWYAITGAFAAKSWGI